MNAKSFNDILQAGEAEWLENAPDTYSHDAPDVWQSDILPRLLSASLEEIDVEDLRLFCPKMLGKLPKIFAHDKIDDIRQAISELLADEMP